MKQLPEGLASYSRTRLFDETTMAKGLMKDHSTKAGVWGVIHVVEGALRYSIPAQDEEFTLTPGRNGVVEPEVFHHISPVGAVKFYIEFWR